MKRCLCWALRLILPITVTGWSVAVPAVPTFPLGIYALTPAHQEVPAAILSDAAWPAVVVRAFWSKLEPRHGHYDWSYLDREIQRVASHGKRVSLAVTTGGLMIPDWMQSKNIRWFTFEDHNRYHASYGRRVRTALFWDPEYLKFKLAFIAAMGKRYQEEPALVLVSAQCANATTDDWFIPAQGDDIKRWQQMSFSEDKLIAACKQVLDATMAAFPRQTVRIAIGRVPEPLAKNPDGVAEAIWRYASERYPGRLVVQRHNLSARTPEPSPVRRRNGWDWLYKHRPWIAAQALWPVTDTKSCRMNGGSSPCVAETMMEQMAQTANRYGLLYVEMYQSDLLDRRLRPILVALGRDLVQQGRSAQSQESPPRPPGQPHQGRAGGGIWPPQHRAPGEEPWDWVNDPSMERRIPAGVEHHTFESKAIKGRVGYSIYLPEQYAQSTDRYPVLYWLHGKNGNEVRSAHVARYLRDAVKRGVLPPTIMVFVNGGAGSFYSDSHDGRYPVETMLIDELIPHIDATYRTIREGRARMLEGFSMGGFGALKFAAKYPQMFGSVTTFGGAFLGERFPPKRRDADAIQLMFDNDLQRFVENSPGFWLKKNHKQIVQSGLKIRIVAGAADPTRVYNEGMHTLLGQLAIPHEYLVLPEVRHVVGQYYDTDLRGSFAFHAAAMREHGLAGK